MSCKNCACNKSQTGGSDWMHSFHADTVFGGPRALSQATLKYIERAPMFNPLKADTIIPTLPSVGIVPNAAYLGSLTREAQQNPKNNGKCNTCL